MDDSSKNKSIFVIDNIEYVTVQKACTILQCSDKYIYKLVSDGKVESLPPKPMLVKLMDLIDD